MHLSELLLEKGIQTAKIDMEVRKTIAEYAPQWVQSFIQRALQENSGELRPEPEDYDSEYHWVKYNVATKWMNQNQTQVCDETAKKLSRVLTQIMRDQLRATVGENFFIYLRGFKNASTSEPIEVGPGSFSVFVEIEETTTDPKAKTCGGYASPGHGILKQFIKQADVMRAISALVTESMVGESYENGIKILLKTICPTFAHEYAHIEQFARGQRDRNDLGYITTGSEKGKKWGGKRGGLLRYPERSPLDRVRYLGSNHEIDSFASGAAAEIVNDIDDRHDDFNRIVDDFRQSIAYGYISDNPSYQQYYNLLTNTADGYYKELGVKPDEVKTVWTRFLKLVFQKLEAYKKPTTGKASASTMKYHRMDFRPKWVQITKEMPRSAAVTKIAAEIGGFVARHAEDHHNPAEITQRILKGETYGVPAGDYIDSAANFLRKFYFGDAWEMEEQQDKMIAVFRRLVAKNYHKRVEDYASMEQSDR